MAMKEPVWMRVPKELATMLDEIARKKGVTARGRWAVYARMILMAEVEK